ncbi:MAG: glycosyltransferase family 39 protein [Anaerolineaceae bacterium]|nr:glycosyltransferase family 39 protein [Anaerolineaceae bacterium]
MSKSALGMTKKWVLALFLLVCFAAAAGIRVYDLTDLPLDFHPARQLQSMLKARGMYAATGDATQFSAEQIDIALKQWRGQPTQEPEVMEHLAVWTYQVIGHENLWFPRFYAILFWLIGGLGLYFFLRNLTGPTGAVIGTVFFLFCPYGISASRAFMPDPLMVALLIWSAWALLRWSQKPGWGWAVLAGLLSGLTVYVKLTAVFYIAALFFCLMIATYGVGRMWRRAQFWLIGVLAVLPGFLYNYWGIFVSRFINSAATDNRILPSMLVQMLSYVHWNEMVVSVTGIVAFLLAVAGLFVIQKGPKRAAALGLWIGYFLYGIVFIYYYTTHDYYHLPLIVLVAVGLAGLAEVLLPRLLELIHPVWIARALLPLLILLGVGETVWQVRSDFKRVDYRPQAEFWAELGQKVRTYHIMALTEDYNGRLSYWGWQDAAYLPAMNELVHRELAGHGGDAMATFQAMVQGNDFFLVTLLDDPTMSGGLMDLLKQTYPIYDQGSGYIIFDLRPQK